MCDPPSWFCNRIFLRWHHLSTQFVQYHRPIYKNGNSYTAIKSKNVLLLKTLTYSKCDWLKRSGKNKIMQTSTIKLDLWNKTKKKIKKTSSTINFVLNESFVKLLKLPFCRKMKRKAIIVHYGSSKFCPPRNEVKSLVKKLVS